MFLRTIETLSFCVDCHQYHATGDGTFFDYHYNNGGPAGEQAAEDRLNEVVDGFRAIQDRTKCLGIFQDADTAPDEFSRSACDCCGSALAGERHAWQAVGS